MEEEKKDITVIDEGIKDEFFMHCCIAALAHSCLRGGSNKNQTKVKMPGRIHL
mgnify:CR=1 FL=1